MFYEKNISNKMQRKIKRIWKLQSSLKHFPTEVSPITVTKEKKNGKSKVSNLPVE